MAWFDYKEEELIAVDPHKIRGGIDTICALARLFNVGLDCQDAYSPILLCIGDKLTQEERQTLEELISEHLSDLKE